MSANRTLYIVCGSIGEYSDRREWCVRAFDSEDTAKHFVEKAQREAQTVAAKFQAWNEKHDYPIGPKLKRKLVELAKELPDSRLDLESSYARDASYFYSEVPFAPSQQKEGG